MTSEGIRVAPQTERDFASLAEAFKNGDKAIQKRIRTGLQEAARPLALEVIRVGSEQMPARGGLRARIAASKGAVSAGLSGKNPKVTIRLTDAQRDSLAGLDTGKLRHPVFGEKRAKLGGGGNLESPWVSQTIPAHAFDKAFLAGAPVTALRLRVAIEKALQDIAKDA